MQTICPFRLAQPTAGDVQGDGGDEGAIDDLGTVGKGDDLVVLVDGDDRLAVALTFEWDELGDALPDGSSTTFSRESEDCIGPPSGIFLALDDVGDGPVDVDGGDTLSEPVALHHGGWDCPDLEVVRTHEDICNTRTHNTEDPFIKVGRLALGESIGHLGLDAAGQTFDLILLVEGRDVVLKRVGNPTVLEPDVRDAFEGVPGFWAGTEGGVEEVVKVLVVRKDDVASHVVEEALWGDVCACKATCF